METPLPVSPDHQRSLALCIFFALVGCERPLPSLDEVSTPGGPATDGPPSDTYDNLRIEISRFPAHGGLAPLVEPLLPSLPSPEITVGTFEISDPRYVDEQILCDLQIEGSVSSDHCDRMPGDDAVINEVRFVVNGDDEPMATARLEVSKADRGSIERPFAFGATFGVTLTDVAVTEGVNTLHVTARDPVYGLDGQTGWSFGIAATIEDSGEVTAVTVSKRPERFTTPSQGELTLYTLFVRGIENPSPNLRLVVGDDHAIEFPIATFDRVTAAAWGPGDSRVPVTFSARPTGAATTPPHHQRSETVREVNVVRRFGSPDHPAISDEMDFYTGWGLGFGFGGYDLVFSPDTIAVGAASPDPEINLLGTTVAVSLREGDTIIHQQSLGFPSGFSEASYATIQRHETPKVLWQLTERMRTNETTGGDPVIALIISDLADVGMPEVSLNDWRGGLLSKSAEVLESASEMSRGEPPVLRGYRVGRILGEAYRVHTASDDPDERNGMLKSEFLGRLAQRPYFR